MEHVRCQKTWQEQGDPELYVHFDWLNTSPKLSDKFCPECILLNMQDYGLKNFSC